LFKFLEMPFPIVKSFYIFFSFLVFCLIKPNFAQSASTKSKPNCSLSLDENSKKMLFFLNALGLVERSDHHHSEAANDSIQLNIQKKVAASILQLPTRGAEAVMLAYNLWISKDGTFVMPRPEYAPRDSIKYDNLIDPTDPWVPVFAFERGIWTKLGHNIDAKL
jgi:hypothetical protein